MSEASSILRDGAEDFPSALCGAPRGLFGARHRAALFEADRDCRRHRSSTGHVARDAAGYWTETDTTPAPIMPSARAALTDTSMILPRINGPRSLTRHWIERPDRAVTVTTLPIGLVR